MDIVHRTHHVEHTATDTPRTHKDTCTNGAREDDGGKLRLELELRSRAANASGALADRALDPARDPRYGRATGRAAHLRAQLTEYMRVPPFQSSCDRRTPANVRVDDLPSPYDAPSMQLMRAT